MASHSISNLDLNQKQLLNAVFHKLTTAPENPEVGQFYYNTNLNIFLYWNGTSWVNNSVIDISDIPDLSSLYIAVSKIGSASGVAPLNSSSKIDNTYLNIGSASGVAPLNSSSKIDNTYLNIDTTLSISSDNAVSNSAVTNGRASLDLGNLSNTGLQKLNTVLESNGGNSRLGFWVGTKSQYNTSAKSSSVIYFVTDTSEIYLGSTLISSATTNVNIATTSVAGIVKPDGTTITIDNDGTIHSTADNELNNPYTLFDSKYSPNALYNASWLKSEGQYNSGAVYVTCYEGLLVEYNTDIEVGTTTTLPSGTDYTKKGLSVKLSTETFDDYDFVVNTIDTTFRLPLLDGSEDLPSDRQEVISFDVNVDYRISKPVNGFYTIRCRIANQGNGVSIENKTTQQSIRSTAPSAGILCATTMFVPANNQVGLWKSSLDITSPVDECYFIPAQGNGSLYYYVGETVQNANLINAGRIEEEIASLIPDNSSLIAGYAMPSTRYIDLTLGASGSSYTAPADGWFLLSKITGSYSCFATLVVIGGLKDIREAALNTSELTPCIAVRKGNTVEVTYNATGETRYFRFVYAEGSESEVQ